MWWILVHLQSCAEVPTRFPSAMRIPMRLLGIRCLPVVCLPVVCLPLVCLPLVCLPLAAVDQIPILTDGTGLFDGPTLLGDLGGLRSGFAEHGLLFEARLLADATLQSHDGLVDGDRNYARYLLEAGITLDVAKFVGLAGAGRFTATWQSVGGDNATNQIGVLQRVTWLDADGRDQLGRLFYVQPFFDEAFTLKAGKDEVIRDFMSNPFGAEFLNEANRRQLSAFAMPEFPDSATMGLANLTIGSWFAQASGYDGRSVTLGKETGKDWLSIPESDYFLIAETGISWDDRRKGHVGGVKFGLWEHTGTFANYSGGQTEGVNGYYIQADYILMNQGQSRSPQGIGGWVHFGESDDEVSLYKRQLALGGIWRGLMPTRPFDSLGVSHSWLATSRAPGSPATADERMLEIYYSFRAAGWLALQPDFQWFVHPGGQATTNDLYVASIRGTVTF
jgi:porin